jgi:hypothetical protein
VSIVPLHAKQTKKTWRTDRADKKHKNERGNAKRKKNEAKNKKGEVSRKTPIQTVWSAFKKREEKNKLFIFWTEKPHKKGVLFGKSGWHAFFLLFSFVFFCFLLFSFV